MQVKSHSCSLKERLLPHEVPQRPWQKLGTDIFELNSNSCLVVVDYYSKYPELCLLKDETASSVITSMFSRHGIPDQVVVDKMPFSSKSFRQFARDWGFAVCTSSPRYPQSNGMSERAIQTIKNLLRKAFEDGNDPYIALLEYRNTIRIRKGKTWEPAIVSEKHTAPRSFIVTTLDGFAYRRNRRHLLPTNEAPPVITGPAYDDPVAPVAATPAVVITPPVAASNAELPAAGSTNYRSDLQTPTKCTSLAGLSDYQQDFDRIIS